jgi:hypothetical protein
LTFIDFISTEKAAYKISTFLGGLKTIQFSSLQFVYRADSCEANYRKSTV